ncbi:MAG: lipo-like protein [Gammaproteobacteria bacterium]|nr:MAG: lipo-like protein [Gammaproteobacteria bacterium]
MYKVSSVVKPIAVLLLGLSANTLVAEEAIINGSAIYRERIALPENAVFEATLEDISLMDVAAEVLGQVTIDPAGRIPIAFAIKYNTDDIKQRHRYSVRGKITVDGKLKFITDTTHPVLTGNSKEELVLKMITVP